MNRGGNKTGKGDEIDAPINERKKMMSIERKKRSKGRIRCACCLTLDAGLSPLPSSARCPSHLLVKWLFLHFFIVSERPPFCPSQIQEPHQVFVSCRALLVGTRQVKSTGYDAIPTNPNILLKRYVT